VILFWFINVYVYRIIVAPEEIQISEEEIKIVNINIDKYEKIVQQLNKKSRLANFATNKNIFKSPDQEE
ncbi:hypothetical protein D6821_00710, partial [Candidatus Parcubacteria bacterium]